MKTTAGEKPRASKYFKPAHGYIKTPIAQLLYALVLSQHGDVVDGHLTRCNISDISFHHPRYFPPINAFTSFISFILFSQMPSLTVYYK